MLQAVKQFSPSRKFSLFTGDVVEGENDLTFLHSL